MGCRPPWLPASASHSVSSLGPCRPFCRAGWCRSFVGPLVRLAAPSLPASPDVPCGTLAGPLRGAGRSRQGGCRAVVGHALPASGWHALPASARQGDLPAYGRHSPCCFSAVFEWLLGRHSVPALLWPALCAGPLVAGIIMIYVLLAPVAAIRLVMVCLPAQGMALYGLLRPTPCRPTCRPLKPTTCRPATVAFGIAAGLGRHAIAGHLGPVTPCRPSCGHSIHDLRFVAPGCGHTFGHSLLLLPALGRHTLPAID